MHVNFKALPALIALAILVAVFAAISRQHSKERVRLWLVGWAFVLLRSVIQFIHPTNPRWSNLYVGMGLGALQLASISFVVSVAPKAMTLRRQLVLGGILGIPALTLTFAIITGVESRLFYYTVVAVTLISTLLLIARWYRRVTVYVVAICVGMIALAASIVWSVANGHEEYSVHLILAAMNLFAAGLFWYRLHRTSAGVLAAVLGFVAWGVFPLIVALQKFTSLQLIESEVWNIPKYLVAVGMIVTLLEDQIRWSEHLAYHDALTGLPNRRLVQDRLIQAMAHADRSSHKVAVLLLDLDDFKEVNDTLGHKVGDAALQQVVARLSSRMRASDTLGRTGGDEFTVISEVANHQGAQTLVSALESALVLPLKIDGRLVRTGVSVGYALYPDSGSDPLELYAVADRAMYAVKRGSRALRSSAGGNDFA